MPDPAAPRDRLFLLAAPFKDAALGDADWFCPHCALIEGALIANPHWLDVLEIARVGFARPRPAVVALLGEAEQSLPALIIADPARAPSDARVIKGLSVVKDAAAITRYLAARYGGSAPHP